MQPHFVLVALYNHTAHVVVEYGARRTLKLLEGLDVGAQQIFQTLIEKEVQSQGARVGKGNDKARETTAGLPDANFSKVGPNRLALALREKFAAVRRVPEARGEGEPPDGAVARNRPHSHGRESSERSEWSAAGDTAPGCGG